MSCDSSASVLPPTNTMIGSGPRRAVKVEPGLTVLPRVKSRTVSTTTTAASASSQRGACRIRVLIFAIVDLNIRVFPLPVFFNKQNSHVIPELQPGDGMANQCLRAQIFLRNQIVLRVHLVPRRAPSQFGAQILFLHPAPGEIDSNFRDFIIAFGLVEIAPVVAHLQFDLVLGLLELAPGLFVSNQRRAIAIALLHTVERQIDRQSRIPMVTLRVGQRKASSLIRFAVDRKSTRL